MIITSTIEILESAKLIASTVTYSNKSHQIYTLALDMSTIDTDSVSTHRQMLILGPLSDDTEVTKRTTFCNRLTGALGSDYDKYNLTRLSDRKTKTIVDVIRNRTDISDTKKYKKGVDVTEDVRHGELKELMGMFDFNHSLSTLSKPLINLDAWTVNHLGRSVSLKYDDSLTVFLRHVNGHRYDVLTYANGETYALLDSRKDTLDSFVKMLVLRYFVKLKQRVDIDTIHKPCFTQPINVDEENVIEIDFRSFPYLITNTRKNIKLQDIDLKRTNTPHGLDILDIGARTCMGVLLDFDEPIESLEILNTVNQSMEDVYILTKSDTGYNITPYSQVIPQ